MVSTIANVTGHHSLTIAAYPIKEEMGGGYRGAVLIRATRDRQASERLATLDEARVWAQRRVHDLLDGRGFAIAPLRRRGEYLANVWTREAYPPLAQLQGDAA